MNAITQTAVFHGESVRIISHNGQFWLTAEDVGRCLGYSQANWRKGILSVYSRHIDEFTAEDTCVVKLTTQDQGREFRVFSKTGCIKLGFFSNTTTAKQFRKWAAKVLAGHDTQETLVKTLQSAYLTAYPETAKLLHYRELGLKQAEIGKLLNVSPNTIRHRLKKLTTLGLADYQPDPGLSSHGRLGYAKMREALAFKSAQIPLNFEEEGGVA